MRRAICFLIALMFSINQKLPRNIKGEKYIRASTAEGHTVLARIYFFRSPQEAERFLEQALAAPLFVAETYG